MAKMDNQAVADYSHAYKCVLEKLKEAYGVDKCSDISNAMVNSEDLDCGDEIFKALNNIDCLSSEQLEGAAAAIANIIIGEDDLNIESGSIYCELVSTLAVSVMYDTESAACELVRQMFGDDKLDEFCARLADEMSSLFVAHTAREENLEWK